MISIIATVVVLGLVYWAVSLLPIPEPFATVVKVIFIIILVIYLLSFLTGGLPQVGFPMIR